MKTFIVILLSIACLAQAQENSHILANLPEAADFPKFFIRDAGEYLSRTHSAKIEVSYELLRQEPTQSGVAYPKFYAWVRGTSADKKLVVEGAMRVAAVEKKQFDVIDFITKDEIMADPNRLEAIFPVPLIPAIRDRAHFK